jgi:hypothetical protein
MPGTSMPAFDDLPQSDRRLLAQEVMQLRRAAIREQLRRATRQAGEEPDEAEIRRAEERLTTPGEPIRLPSHWATDGQAIVRGKAIYQTLGCAKCHGDDGTGSADQVLFDDQGEPTRPRDLLHEPFKGGRERKSIYLRLAAGMPGTAHPSAWNSPQEQLIDLVEYVCSLAREPQQLLNNRQRRNLATSRAYLDSLSSSDSKQQLPGSR